MLAAWLLSCASLLLQLRCNNFPPHDARRILARKMPFEADGQAHVYLTQKHGATGRDAVYRGMLVAIAENRSAIFGPAFGELDELCGSMADYFANFAGRKMRPP